jgi:hypothetical protein
MQMTQLLKIRSLLMVVLPFRVTATPARAEQKPKRMMQEPSVKELVPESPNFRPGRCSPALFARLFKLGSTEYTHVGAHGSKGARPFYSRCVPFKDLVYQVKMAAISSGFSIMLFDVASTENEHQAGASFVISVFCRAGETAATTEGRVRAAICF